MAPLRASGLTLLPLAVALAGCTASPGLYAPEPARFEPCTPGEERREERRGMELIILVEGCLVASHPRLPEVPERIEVAFEVEAGARRLAAMLHLHGPERVEAALLDPSGFPAASARAQGNEVRDSLVRLEVPQPVRGAWQLAGSVEEPVLARGWTAVIAVGR